MIIGDFNLTLDVDIDRVNTFSNNNKARDKILEIMDQYLLRDTWRIQNIDKREYSWFKGGNIQKASRIDFALISGGIDQSVKMIQYISSIKTDHRAIYVCFQFLQQDRGCGYWKFNTSLLQRQTFVQEMNLELQLTIIGTQSKSPIERWEIIKRRIKKFTVQYSKTLATENSQVIANLSEKVNEYEARMPLDREEFELYVKTKTDFEEKMFERTKGLIFRTSKSSTVLGNYIEGYLNQLMPTGT